MTRGEGLSFPQIYLVSSVFVYSLVLISLIDTNPAPSAVHFFTWLAGFILEVFLLVPTFTLYTTTHWHNEAPTKGPRRDTDEPDRWEVTELVFDVVRLVVILALLGSYVVFKRIQTRRCGNMQQGSPEDPDETTGLLQESGVFSGDVNGHGANAPGVPAYGSTKQTPKADRPATARAGWSRPTTTPSTTWWEYLRGYSLLFPYMWPSKSRKLQIVVILCLILVFLQRVVNVLVPYQVGVVTDILSGEDGGPPQVPWAQICLFIVYRLMQGSSGILGALRSSLWIPIGQYSYQALSTSAFEHVHSLSLDFHLGKRTGEVLSALSKGNSINTFLEQVTFSVVPMLVDLCVAIGYFLIAFDAYYALVVAIVTFNYMYLTIRLAQWRADIRRTMVNAGREEDAVKYTFL